MKITYNWLKDYVEVPWQWPELVDRLTMAGLEREGVEDLAARLEGVVVGHIESREQHPNADRLSVCRVATGDAEPRTVVCGAPNVDTGQKVAVILPGARLPDGTRIKEAKLRGVRSSGMICSEVELGLGEDASGIMVLPDDWSVGAPFAQAAGLDDVMLDFEVTPNRPDCLSLVGLAREVAAQTGAPLRLPEVDLQEDGRPAADETAVALEDETACPRYVARLVRGVRVGPSPVWLQNRLKVVGQRPINNIVDITNYVMLESGQPLHAFDLDRLAEKRIVVRRARAGEKLETLDGAERALRPEDLVIADAEKAVALAGVMGGANSEVHDGTCDILLESAHFDPATVRRTASRLGIHTEASMRFERGTDWDMPARAAERAAALIAELAGGTVAPGAVDAYPRPGERTRITLRLERLKKVLGIAVDADESRRILTALGCQTEGSDPLQVQVPSFRPDLEREIDLVEEVGRVYGYHRVPERQQLAGPLPGSGAPLQNESRRLRRRLNGLGFDEVSTNTIVPRRWLEMAGHDPDAAPRLVNPPADTQAHMRADIVPSLAETARHNFNRRAQSVWVFELGRCFGPEGESRRLAGLLAGDAEDSPWQTDRRPSDLLDLKGVLEALFEGAEVESAASEHPLLRPGHAAVARAAGLELGYWGQLRPALAAEFDLERPIYIFELDFGRLASLLQGNDAAYVPLPRFPAVERDLALVVPDGTAAGDVVAGIRATDPLIESVNLFDVYRGDQLEAGRKSLACAVRLRAADRTLADKEADAVIERVLKRLGSTLDAHLR